MVHIVGAGCGAADLITLRGKRLLEEADLIVYAGSLVNPDLLAYARPECELMDSAKMTLEEIVGAVKAAESAGKTTVRLHSGDPSLYGAIGEQMREFDRLGIEYDVTPGVSAFAGAAAALKTEYTLPGVSQSVIITRAAGRTPVPEGESLRSFAAHGATMVLFLSTGLLAGVAGMALSAYLMGRAAAGGATAAPGHEALAAYRGYFRAVLLLLLPLLAAVWRIPPLAATENRSRT